MTYDIWYVVNPFSYISTSETFVFIPVLQSFWQSNMLMAKLVLKTSLRYGFENWFGSCIVCLYWKTTSQVLSSFSFVTINFQMMKKLISNAFLKLVKMCMWDVMLDLCHSWIS